MPIPPRFHCQTCQDWGTVVAPNGRGTIPCPGDQINETPCTAPTPRTTTLQEETK